MNKLPRFAIALEYDGKQAPLVTAKGHDEIANRILQLAHESNVPIQKDNELALPELKQLLRVAGFNAGELNSFAGKPGQSRVATTTAYAESLIDIEVYS